MVKEKNPKVIRDKLKDKIIRDISIFFWNIRRKRRKKKKKHNERIIKDRIIRDIRTLSEQEEDYYEPKRVINFWSNSYIEYETNGDKNKNLSLNEYLNKIKPYLRNIIINLQNSDSWEIQLTIAFNFIPSKDAEEERAMHSSRGNIKFTPYSDANDVIEKLFQSPCWRYQEKLETSMKESDLVFDSVQLMYYKCDKVSFRQGGSYIDCPDWIKKAQ